MLLLRQPMGVTIELIATKDMVAGTVLVVDLIESVATSTEYKLLLRELKLTGQPFARQVFRDRRRTRTRKLKLMTETTTAQQQQCSTSTTPSSTTTITKEEL